MQEASLYLLASRINSHLRIYAINVIIWRLTKQGIQNQGYLMKLREQMVKHVKKVDSVRLVTRQLGLVAQTPTNFTMSVMIKNLLTWTQNMSCQNKWIYPSYDLEIQD